MTGFNPTAVEIKTPYWQFTIPFQQWLATNMQVEHRPDTLPGLLYRICLAEDRCTETVKSWFSEDPVEFKYETKFENPNHKDVFFKQLQRKFGIAGFGSLGPLEPSYQKDVQTLLLGHQWEYLYDYAHSYGTVSNMFKENAFRSGLTRDELQYRADHPRRVKLSVKENGEYGLFLHHGGFVTPENYEAYLCQSVDREFADDVANVMKTLRLKFLFN